MVNKKKIWTKKEGTDDICTEPGSMTQVYPTSVNLKEDWEETANQEVVTSTRHASNSRRSRKKLIAQSLGLAGNPCQGTATRRQQCRTLTCGTNH
ncbi:uncharacterized protein LOC126295152 isoform X3 [Schistocerca gregaria]|uniref:uncharacterized protein LOC126295152 isoform X3 n=1 Tax=Schistocerca gregaria TaxID=7010 RepID=UPI00211ED137|nr:uncharacterized protein LOC126295152 isoform X3 [Schistocerca gregaria]